MNKCGYISVSVLNPCGALREAFFKTLHHNINHPLRQPPFFVFLALFLVLQVGAISVDRYEKELVCRKGIPAQATIVSMARTAG